MNEEFEYFSGKQDHMFDPPTERESFYAGYLAGAKAALEKAAEVADNEANGFRNTRIAAAIRKIGVE